MIDFNKNSAWDLKPIELSAVRDEVKGLLVLNENVISAFKTIRDQLIFTNKRIISIDIQGLTGTRKAFASMPYSKIEFFTIQTPGFGELIADSELIIMFSNGFVATFEFKGNVDIGKIGRTISEYVLN